MIKFVCLVAGLLFGFGLHHSQMTDPSVVLAFVTVDKNWDPSLAFVMIGALGVFIPGYQLIKKQKKPILSESFNLPTRSNIDKNLVIGAVIFGLGWGLAGICPGPALANLALLDINLLAFVGTMTLGIWLSNIYNSSIKS